MPRAPDSTPGSRRARNVRRHGPQSSIFLSTATKLTDPLPVLKSSKALNYAIDLMRFPRFAASFVAAPVPSDVLQVMRIAASAEECQSTASEVGIPPETLQWAARLYLKSVLFHEEADCYRILGVTPETPHTAVRQHLFFLLSWLHPDRNKSWDVAYLGRVVSAWQEISRIGPSSCPASSSNLLSPPRRRFRLPWIAIPVAAGSRSHRHWPAWLFLLIASLSVVVLVRDDLLALLN